MVLCPPNNRVRFLVSLRKATQQANRSMYAFVPDILLNCEWTDEKLYKRYGLTKSSPWSARWR